MAPHGDSDADPPVGAPPKRKRCWFRFSLRSLLISTLICAVGSAWVARKIEQKRREREAVDAIRKLGGAVYYDYEAVKGAEPRGPPWLRNLFGQNFFGDVVGVHLDKSPGPVWLTRIHELTFRDAQADETGRVHLEEMPDLRTLTLEGARVTDTELAHLGGLAHLHTLSFQGTKVSDAGLAHLKALTELTTLDLQGTNVTDEGLVNLNTLPQLQLLDLSLTNVTDAGLLKLKSLTQLRSLRVRYTRVTDAGMKNLQKALPNCQIGRW
jgi:Leucine Rich repeat